MSKYLKLFGTTPEYDVYINGGGVVLPNVSVAKDAPTTVYYNPIIHDYSEDYLTFVALEDGTFKLSENAVSYSLDNGETWTELTANTESPTVTTGNKIMWKGEITPSSNGIGTFSATGNFDVQGNIMSLLYGDNYKGKTDLTGKIYAFSNLFRSNKKIVNAKNLSLPATTLAGGCYQSMFNGCTSLTTAPELPATTLRNYCYGNMFNGCTNLTSAPVLPATTLADRCYTSMFGNCTSLVTAPELPATTLANYCYGSMFNGCTRLNYIKAMFTTTPNTNYTGSWVNGVAATGTFVKNSAATWNVAGVNGIPDGWTIETASE